MGVLVGQTHGAATTAVITTGIARDAQGTTAASKTEAKELE